MKDIVQGKKLNCMADTVEIVTREMQINDFYKSLLSIWLSSHHDADYEKDEFLIKNENSYLHTNKDNVDHIVEKVKKAFIFQGEPIKEDDLFKSGLIE